MTAYQYPVTVFYEDTDMAGIVYYANYLRYIERARSMMVREADVDQLKMQEDGVVFVVRKVNAEYHQSARLMDDLDVRTTISWSGRAQMLFHQNVYRGDTLIFSADVTVVCMRENGRPTRIPAEFCQEMAKYTKNSTH